MPKLLDKKIKITDNFKETSCAGGADSCGETLAAVAIPRAQDRQGQDRQGQDRQGQDRQGGPGPPVFLYIRFDPTQRTVRTEK